MRWIVALLVCVFVLSGSAYVWAEWFPSELNAPIHRAACAAGLAQRGCCSWHKGVCGCTLGTVVCCDGTDSPSCRC